MRFFSKLKDIWSHEELRNKIGITLGLILVYRIGSFIVLPGVNSDVLAAQMDALERWLRQDNTWWRWLRSKIAPSRED